MSARRAHRPAVMGHRGMVASAHPLASAAGLEMLWRGGNAVDAAIAIAATLNVVEPFMSGIGGDGLLLLTMAGRRSVLDFMGKTPQHARPGDCAVEELQRGPKSSLVPGNFGGWWEALRAHGRLSPAEVFGPAIRYAEEGFPLTHRGAEFVAEHCPRLGPDAAGVFCPNGKPPAAGTRLSHPALAKTLRQLVERGSDLLYRGELGERLYRAVQAAGGWLTADDLDGFSPTWTEPIGIQFGTVEVFSVPPPAAGMQLLETLAILEGCGLRELGHNSAESLHLLIETVKLTMADRIAFQSLPEPPVQGILSPGYASAQRARIDPTRAAVCGGERYDPNPPAGAVLSGDPYGYQREHTTHFSVVDGDGNAASITQTLGSPFGSGFVAGDTGILMNNLLQWNDLDPRSPNVLAPSRKVETRMAPLQAFREGRLILALGTPGSYGIPQTSAQMFLNMLVYGMDIQEAIEAPRVRVYTDRTVDMEARIPAAVRVALAARGHAIRVLPDWSWVVGGGQGVSVDPGTGTLSGGADPRRDGYV
ncbi:MAG TPA: gamma-glutamyltransferase, partial [Candidatus Baltobacteraceae bacterium]|nr:gamma-glutamyltransferase [Candidatus Baltobacteraceae bacterium]